MAERDSEGNLLPVEYKCTICGNEVEISLIPLCRGEIRSLEHNYYDEDEILKKLIVPKYTDDEIDRLKLDYRKDLIKGILECSGVTFNRKSQKLKVKDDWAKELMEKSQKKQQRKMLLFLHKH